MDHAFGIIIRSLCITFDNGDSLHHSKKYGILCHAR